MYEIVEGETQGLADVEAFIAFINGIDADSTSDRELLELFDPRDEIVVARAPGRLDVMGGIADYSGSLVLEMPTAEATMAALQVSTIMNDRTIRVISLGGDANHRSPSFRMSLDDLLDGDRPVIYEKARRFFQQDPDSQWAAYAVGTLLVLMREKGLRPTRGLRLLIDSRVPEGKGVSSSAAIEVAVMNALAAASGIHLSAKELAVLCQKVENFVVGAPCGVMDQMTSACGTAGELMALLCQPAELQGAVTIPDDLWVWGVDSGVRHSVGGADYGSVRVGAFMGYRILAERAGLPVLGGGDDPVQVQDELWRGYLANVSASEYEQYYASHIPEFMSGADFLEQYGGTTDTVTTVDPDRDYAVRAATGHPVHEHFRVRSYGELMRAPLSPTSMELLGELMYQSHASYSACGLGCDGTDLLVDLVREVGPAGGLYGAKITGGGSGGTVAILGRRDAEAAVRELAGMYAEKTGHEPYIFAGSSPGAAAFGVLRLAPK